MQSPTETVLAALENRGCQPREQGGGWTALCPAHEDRNPSLSISIGEDGRALVRCHAGCDAAKICTSLGISLVDLMPPPSPSHPKRKQNATILSTYDYRSETGELIFQVARMEPKGFRQRRPKPGGGWDWSVKGVRVVPYRLPDLLASLDQTIYVVEGEKDADNLAKLGLQATCNAGGAGKWLSEHAAFLRDRDVVILPDNDEPGRKHAQGVASSLYGVAKRIRIVELSGVPAKGDVSNWLASGGTREDLLDLVERGETWNPTTQPWPEIESLEDRDLPTFPIDLLPEGLRDWVAAESEATQTPADLAGMLALAACSASIARRVTVEGRPGWHEPTNLFVTVVLAPGNRKSGVFQDALRPLRELEAELVESSRSEIARLQSERRQDEHRLRKLEKLAGEQGDQEARREAEDLAARLAETPIPASPRLLVDDATNEKVGALLAEQDGRIASMSPEGGVFDLMAGLYSKSGTPQFNVYLMGHSGDDLVTDRVSRQSVHVTRPALTCAYTVQPAVMQGLAGNPAFRGRGLLARFLYAIPPSWIGSRKIAASPVSEAISRRYDELIRRLAGIDPGTVLRLSTPAAELLPTWEEEIESQLAEGGDLEAVCDWGAKLAGATLRIAGILHCVEFGPQPEIGWRTLHAAIEIARYLIPHAEAAHAMMGAQDETPADDAQYVLRWIKRRHLTSFTKRDAQQHGKRRFPKADDVDEALAELVRRGYLRPQAIEPPRPGRPPSPAFEFNPAVFEGRTTEVCSRNSQNSEFPTPITSSGNIENGLDAERMQVTL